MDTKRNDFRDMFLDDSVSLEEALAKATNAVIHQGQESDEPTVVHKNKKTSALSKRRSSNVATIRENAETIGDSFDLDDKLSPGIISSQKKKKNKNSSSTRATTVALPKRAQKSSDGDEFDLDAKLSTSVAKIGRWATRSSTTVAKKASKRNKQHPDAFDLDSKLSTTKAVKTGSRSKDDFDLDAKLPTTGAAKAKAGKSAKDEFDLDSKLPSTRTRKGGIVGVLKRSSRSKSESPKKRRGPIQPTLPKSRTFTNEIGIHSDLDSAVSKMGIQTTTQQKGVITRKKSGRSSATKSTSPKRAGRGVGSMMSSMKAKLVSSGSFAKTSTTSGTEMFDLDGELGAKKSHRQTSKSTSMATSSSFANMFPKKARILQVSSTASQPFAADEDLDLDEVLEVQAPSLDPVFSTTAQFGLPGASVTERRSLDAILDPVAEEGHDPVAENSFAYEVAEALEAESELEDCDVEAAPTHSIDDDDEPLASKRQKSVNAFKALVNLDDHDGKVDSRINLEAATHSTFAFPPKWSTAVFVGKSTVASTSAGSGVPLGQPESPLAVDAEVTKGGKKAKSRLMAPGSPLFRNAAIGACGIVCAVVLIVVGVLLRSSQRNAVYSCSICPPGEEPEWTSYTFDDNMTGITMMHGFSCGELELMASAGNFDEVECAILTAETKDFCGCRVPPEPSAAPSTSSSPTSTGAPSGLPSESPTQAPTTLAPTTMSPTSAPTTLAPTTMSPTGSPTTAAPSTATPTSATEAPSLYTLPPFPSPPFSGNPQNRNFDRFNYRDSDSYESHNDFGPKDWGRIQCNNKDTCVSVCVALACEAGSSDSSLFLFSWGGRILGSMQTVGRSEKITVAGAQKVRIDAVHTIRAQLISAVTLRCLVRGSSMSAKMST